MASYSQRRERQAAARERSREVAAQAVGPVLSLVLGAQLDQAGPGPGDLAGRFGSWEASWSTSREPLLIMTTGHPSERVHRLGLELATLVRDWLDAVRRYLIAAQELSQARYDETYTRVTQERDQPQAEIQAREASVVLLEDPGLADSRKNVVTAWNEAGIKLRELLKAVREET